MLHKGFNYTIYTKHSVFHKLKHLEHICPLYFEIHIVKLGID